MFFSLIKNPVPYKSQGKSKHQQVVKNINPFRVKAAIEKVTEEGEIEFCIIDDYYWFGRR